MATHHGGKGSDSPLLPLLNNSNYDNTNKKIKSVLPFFGFINMIISCGATTYRACLRGDFPMVVFVAFLFFSTYLLQYWSSLFQKLPPSVKSSKNHPLKIGMWVLESSIMLGFAYAFSKFMSLAASISIFGVVICVITLLFYVYFVRDYYCDKNNNNCGVGSSNINEGRKRRKTREYCRNKKASLKKYKHIALALENV